MTHPYGTQTGSRDCKSRGAGSPRRKGRNVIEAAGAETPPPIKKPKWSQWVLGAVVPSLISALNSLNWPKCNQCNVISEALSLKEMLWVVMVTW